MNPLNPIIRFLLAVVILSAAWAGMPLQAQAQEIVEASPGPDPYLVADINTTPGEDYDPYVNDDEVGAVVMDGVLYFTAATEAEGFELWRSDGTLAGTYLLKDIEPGRASSEPGGYVVVGSLLFFVATTDHYGKELWQTDGTPQGTRLTLDTVPGNPSNEYAYIENMVNMNGVLYFSAYDAANGHQLWRSDGSPSGNHIVKDLSADPDNQIEHLTTVGSGADAVLFFAGWESTYGTELWISDGTEGGTLLLRDIYTGTDGSEPMGLIDVDGTLFFVADDGVHGDELWTSDGTPEGTHMVEDVVPGGNFSIDSSLMAVYDGRLFFSADDGVHGRELWASDGTPEGTYMVKDIDNATSDSLQGQRMLVYEGWLYFAADDGVNGEELWRSDGTEAGTTLFKDINQTGDGAGSSCPEYFTQAAGLFFFSADDTSNGQELWVSDGTEAGTLLVEDIYAGTESAKPSGLNALGEQLIFFALVESTSDAEIWLSDGTPDGTFSLFELSDPVFSSDPDNSIAIKGVAYFNADDGLTGRDLWRSDGTPGGTWKVKDINSSSTTAVPDNFTELGDIFFFTASDDLYGRELWVSDGTEAGTNMLEIYAGGSGATPEYLVPLGGQLLFAASDGTHGKELWGSDGTITGTQLIMDIRSGSGHSYPRDLAALDTYVYFRASDSSSDCELWRTDGTAANTALFADINPTGSSYPSYMTRCGNYLLFSADDGINGYEPWVTDGSIASLLMDINVGEDDSDVSGFVEAGTNCFFTAYTEESGYELYVTDGTTANTHLVKDIYPGVPSANIQEMTALGNSLYFSANDGGTGLELWRSNGTPGGTLPVSNIVPGVGSTSPRHLAALANRIFFAAYSIQYGVEAWFFDPAFGQPVRLGDIAPGALSSSPEDFVRIGGQVLFSAGDHTAGANRELWAVSISPDLGLGGSTQLPLYQPGDEAVFVLEVENDGLSVATGVVLTSTLPSELTNRVIASSLAITDTGYTPAYVWQVQDLASGMAGVVVVTSTLDANLDTEGVLTITSQIAMSVNDDYPADNSLDVAFEVNIAPTLTATQQSIVEGAAYSGTLASFSDPGADDTHAAVVDWGDGSPSEAAAVDQGAGQVTGSHTYADDGVFTVTVTVTDSDGGVGEVEFQAAVSNAAPQVVPGADQVLVEGDLLSTTLATFSDPGVEDTHTAVVDWGDDSPSEAAAVDQGAGQVTGSHAYADNGVFTVTVTVTDSDGGLGEVEFQATVSNAAPQAMPAGPQTVDAGVELALVLATFSDLGADDTHAAVVDWGDGSPSAAAVVNQAAHTASGAHTYSAAGSYTVEVTVTDDDGGSVTVSFIVTVIETHPGYQVFLPITQR